MKVIKKLAAAAGIGLAAEGAVIAYFYNRTMKRNHAKTERTMKMSGTDWAKYMPLMKERKAFMMEYPHSNVSITSFDGLKLQATYFPPADGADKRLVIGFHGYTGEGVSNFQGVAHYYLQRGFGMLLPDARAHGASEGEYVGFGCLDRRDALKWIEWALDKAGEDTQILLHGISMGGATVLMTSSMELPPQVKGIVSDCAFTSPKEVFTHALNSMYHLPAFPIIPASDIINRKLAGYGMDECNSRREVTRAKVPILFIHGSNDTFVPYEMCEELYENCSSEKRKLIVEGASHAESYYKDMETYENALTDFIDLVME
ncbi:MAG: alpha/beta hydrolase [Butyrivibrio sp.]|nr:alpha/beta hydrolase [Muribaculum sp.]MCM1551728.1 alpha/beta hydrolase [Butyrivibrio sp.]